MKKFAATPTVFEKITNSIQCKTHNTPFSAREIHVQAGIVDYLEYIKD